jgi:hypothetical protein
MLVQKHYEGCIPEELQLGCVFKEKWRDTTVSQLWTSDLGLSPIRLPCDSTDISLASDKILCFDDTAAPYTTSYELLFPTGMGINGNDLAPNLDGKVCHRVIQLVTHVSRNLSHTVSPNIGCIDLAPYSIGRKRTPPCEFSVASSLQPCYDTTGKTCPPRNSLFIIG